MRSILTRRSFLRACSAIIASLAVSARNVSALIKPPHPTPRPGITSAKVMTRDQLVGTPKHIPLFDSVREIPHVIDGIRCNCGCTDLPGFYSLLSCYEGEGMARDCAVCQGQAKLAARLHKEGKSLDEIRAATDAKFG